MATKPKGRNARLRKEKFRPLAPGLENKLQLRKAINRRARGAIQPKLGEVNRTLRSENLAHQGREHDLKGMYDTYTGNVMDAYQRAQEAANQMLATSSGAIGDSQDNLVAALERSRAGDLAQATTVGGVLPEGVGDEVAAQSAGIGSSALAGLAQSLSSGVGLAANRIGTAGLARTGALEREQGRFGAKQRELRGERKEIKKELPTAREEARKAIMDEELAKASERGRQDIAKKTLKLEGRQTRVAEEHENEEERSNRANEQIAWAGIRTEKQKYRREIEEAGTGAEAEAAEAAAQRYDRGVEIFQKYFENTKPKAYKPQSLYRNLTLAVGSKTALKIMMHGPPRFRQFVKHKKSPNYRGPEKAGPPNPKTGKVGP
jgi:hypothetical protein